MTYWHTTFGIVNVQEVVLEEIGKTIRPFILGSGISPRGCSRPLQRRVVDFGADVPFHDVPKKLREHYRIELCTEVVRKITLNHAEKMEAVMESQSDLPDEAGVKQLIAEADGGMVPIVEFDERDEVEDKRKTRKVRWKEAKLCFSRDVDKVKGVFRATLKSVEVAGDLWFKASLKAGMGRKTDVHCVGDGARWIKEQIDRIFGGKSEYLIDFYHLSEYLAAVGNDCEKTPKKWLKEQQIRLKEGNLYRVLQELEKNLYEKADPPESVKTCYKYITNRLDQLDYL